MMIWVIAALIAACVGILAFILLNPTASSQMKDLVLQQKSSGSMATSALSLADWALSLARREKLATMLSVGGLRLRPAEWVALRFIAAVVLGALGWTASGLLLGIVAAAVTLVTTGVWLRMKVGKARRTFEEDLADTLQLIASSLRSGLSLTAALGVVEADGKEPIRTEIRRVLAKTRIGVSIEDGLDEVAGRMQSQDFAWVALSVRIQKEVGGNLADILSTTTETIRERGYLRRQVKTLSAEGRWSAYILIALPLAVFGVLGLTRREYLTPLWTTAVGMFMVASAIVLMAIGWIWMRRTIKLEV